MNLNRYLPVIKEYNKSDYKYKFTLFIPVYNGEETIIRALKSIEKQTFKDFEVIVIDDGSEDNTELILRGYMSTSGLNLSFHKNEQNIHKMGTILRGLDLAQGEFFLIHDADDECYSDALETYHNAYESIPEKDKQSISGVTANCVDQNGNFIGTNITSDTLFCNSFEYSEQHKIQGEKWGPTKTDVLKQVHIENSIIDKGLIPEAFLWLTIAKAGYITKYLNVVTRVYYVDNENSLSSLNYDQKSFGMAIYSILYLNYFADKYFYKIPLPFIKRLLSLVLASNHLDFSFKTYFNSIHNNNLKCLLVILWPFRKLGKILTAI